MEEDFLCDNLVVAYSPKRGREEDLAPHLVVKSSSQVKRLRKSKTHAPIEKDKTRGRYACLGHRMKHKRCPLDCPERRPKPNQELESSSVVQVKKEVLGNNNKPRISRGNSGVVAKKHILQLEEYNHVSHQVVQSTTPSSSSDREVPNWDSVEWEGLGWDAEHVCLKETEAWMDLKSSSHWEESKSQVLASEDTKPMDDLTKYEEDEIIDSWLNDEGFGNAAQDYESAERNEGREGNVSETSSETNSHFTNIDRIMETMPKVLVTRDMLERWLHEPYFNSLVQGCFVRVMVGEYMENPIYRIAHIHEVHDNFFSNNNLNQMQKNKLLSLQVGENSKLFPIAAISNQPPTESDLRKWHEEMEKSRVTLNPMQFQQKQEIVRFLTRKYSEFPGGLQDIEPMINEPVWNC